MFCVGPWNATTVGPADVAATAVCPWALGPWPACPSCKGCATTLAACYCYCYCYCLPPPQVHEQQMVALTREIRATFGAGSGLGGGADGRRAGGGPSDWAGGSEIDLMSVDLGAYMNTSSLMVRQQQLLPLMHKQPHGGATTYMNTSSLMVGQQHLLPLMHPL